jgi:hypothetical protein
MQTRIQNDLYTPSEEPMLPSTGAASIMNLEKYGAAVPYKFRNRPEDSWPCELHFVYAFIYARACRLQLPRTSECGQESKIEIRLRKLAQPAEASLSLS